MPAPATASRLPSSDDDEHDHQVHAINSKTLSSPHPTSHLKPPPLHPISHSPHPLLLQPTSPFPLSSSLPLPPPFDPTLSSDAAIELDERFILIHKLDRKALSLLSPPSAPPFLFTGPRPPSPSAVSPSPVSCCITRWARSAASTATTLSPSSPTSSSSSLSSTSQPPLPCAPSTPLTPPPSPPPPLPPPPRPATSAAAPSSCASPSARGL